MGKQFVSPPWTWLAVVRKQLKWGCHFRGWSLLPFCGLKRTSSREAHIIPGTFPHSLPILLFRKPSSTPRGGRRCLWGSPRQLRQAIMTLTSIGYGAPRRENSSPRLFFWEASDAGGTIDSTCGEQKQSATKQKSEKLDPAGCKYS